MDTFLDALRFSYTNFEVGVVILQNLIIDGSKKLFYTFANIPKNIFNVSKYPVY